MHGICNCRLVYKTNSINPHPSTLKSPLQEKINKIVLPFFTSHVFHPKSSISKLIGKQVFYPNCNKTRTPQCRSPQQGSQNFMPLLLLNTNFVKQEIDTAHGYRTRSFYNHFHIILRLFDILPNIPFRHK